LIDRYGRRGNLINRDDVYAFQPVEINDESISVFERSVPIDYKRAHVNLELPKEFPKNVDAPVELADILEEGKKEGPSLGLDEQYSKILGEIDIQMKNSVSKTKKGATDQDWFKEASLVVDHLQTVHHIGFNELMRHFSRHAVDMLMPADKFILIKKLYSKIHDIKDPKSTEQKIKDYLDEKMVSVGARVGFLMSDKNKWKIYLVETNQDTNEVKWKEADSEDVRQFEMGGALDKFRVDPKTFASMLGFINLFKSGKEMVFKTKEIGQMQNNTGTRIDSQIKANVVKRVNTIVDKQYSTEEARPISSKGFCIILEILMRQMSNDKKGGKVWYMDPETAAYNGIEKFRT
jgi:hypothetical protein